MSSIRNRIVFGLAFIALSAALVLGGLYASGRVTLSDIIPPIFDDEDPGVGYQPHEPGKPGAPTQFTKTAYDANGNVIPNGGPVNEGDIINYVLSYPGELARAGSKITDVLSSNQTYVDPSVKADGWTVMAGSPGSAGTPYSINNTTTYTSTGNAMSFVATVPKEMQSVAPESTKKYGDGTLPIPIGNRVYGIFHHTQIWKTSTGLSSPAMIMCWDLYSFSPCSISAPPVSGWPQSLNSTTTGVRTTLQIAKHAVVNTRIYYASAEYDETKDRTTPGVGCWETSTETPCKFTPIPNLSWPGLVDGRSFDATAAMNMNSIAAGVLAHQNNVYMHADDGVYCFSMPSATPCSAWPLTPPSLGADTVGSSYLHVRDMILEEAITPSKLYVGIGDANGSVWLRCINLADGSLCAVPWSAPEMKNSIMHGLSPVLDSSGNNTVGVCVHLMSAVSYNGYVSSTAVPQCFNSSTGALLTTSLIPSSIPRSLILSAFHMPPPNRNKILYPGFVNGAQCRNFVTGDAAVCTAAEFTPVWSAASKRDYGYAVDPAHVDECLLGLGDGGILWRFKHNGDTKGTPEKPACRYPITYTFNINDKYCGPKPGRAAWGKATVVGAPTDPNVPGHLVSGEIEFFNGSVSLGTAVANQSNGFAVNVPSSAGSTLTIKFTPTYDSPAFKPSEDYQIILDFTADISPQICYQAEVNECGAAVGNKAVLEIPGALLGALFPTRQTASTDLGVAKGESCKAESVLKVCKVAGSGVAVGTQFEFNAGGSQFTVPAGPAPGGYCKVAGTFEEGALVPVIETAANGTKVNDIRVLPADRISVAPNLDDRSVTVKMGTGVTEVTYENISTQGYLEVCKAGDGLKGEFTFEVSGYGKVVVPAGACSPALAVEAGQIRVTEVGLPDGTSFVDGCYTLPRDRQGECNVEGQTSVVTVVPGDISTMTIAYITNKRK